MERWVTGPFANSRAFHFHWGGDEFPGEINWHVMDVTIEVDGVRVWESGRFHAERISGGADILEQYSGVKAMFEPPRDEIGI